MFTLTSKHIQECMHNDGKLNKLLRGGRKARHGFLHTYKHLDQVRHDSYQYLVCSMHFNNNQAHDNNLCS